MGYTSSAERGTCLCGIVVQIRSELTNLGDAYDAAGLDVTLVVQDCMDSLLLHIGNR